MNRSSKARQVWKWLFRLGLIHVGICVVFPNCGLLGPVDVPVGDSKVMNRISKGPGSSLDEAISTTIRHHSTPKPESEWNEMGLWRKVGSAPATYVPKGYVSSPQDGPSGRWLIDERDGKRLFVPAASHLGYSHQVWESEARKITAQLSVLQ